LQKNNYHKDVSESTSDEAAPNCYEPRDVIEFGLVRIWEDVLQVRPIRLTDNFFELGGHSMLAVRLMSQIFKQFGRELDIATLFHYPTVGDLAIALRRETNGLEQTSLVAIQPQGTKPPFFCVHPSGGAVFRYNNLVRRLGTDYPFYVHTIEFGLDEADAVAVETVASGYIADLQAIRPEGPYLLGGWSTGGVVALEMAQQLRQQGHSVPLLAVIDSHLASAERRAKAREEKVELTDDHIVKAIMKGLDLPFTDRFAQWTQEEQITYLLMNAKEMNFIPGDVVFEQVRHIYHTLVVYSHIASLYAPQNYPQRIDYFRAKPALNLANLTSEEELMVVREREQVLELWQEIAQGGMEVHSVPGNHLEIMDEPNVQELAASLKQCIDRVSEELTRNS
jgi:thioesterase domain-containing protein/acyl carrier protein